MTAETTTRGARLGALVLLLLAVYGLARLSGMEALFSAERLRSIVGQAGPWGPLAFIALFMAGVLAQVPGVIFLSAAPLIFPPAQAWGLCLLAGNLAVNLNFAVVRRLGHKVRHGEFEGQWVQRLFHQLERRPVRAVVTLRLVMIMFPPLTGALALTSLRARDHALGSALGLLLPVSAWVWTEILLMW